MLQATISALLTSNPELGPSVSVSISAVNASVKTSRGALITAGFIPYRVAVVRKSSVSIVLQNWRAACMSFLAAPDMHESFKWIGRLLFFFWDVQATR